MPTTKNQFTADDLSHEARHYRMAACHSLSARTGEDVFAFNAEAIDAEAAKIKAAPALFAALQNCEKRLREEGHTVDADEARAALGLAQKEAA